MCLDIVYSETKRERRLARKRQDVFAVYKDVEWGWKRGKLVACPEIFGYKSRHFKVGINKAKEMGRHRIIQANTGGWYEAGFHCYMTQAERPRNRKQLRCFVKKRDIIAMGKQMGLVVIVASKMRIYKKDWDKAKRVFEGYLGRCLRTI